MMSTLTSFESRALHIMLVEVAHAGRVRWIIHIYTNIHLDPIISFYFAFFLISALCQLHYVLSAAPWLEAACKRNRPKQFDFETLPIAYLFPVAPDLLCLERFSPVIYLRIFSCI